MAGMPRWKQALPKRLLAKYEPVRVPGEGLRLPDFVHATESGYFRLDKPQPGAYVKCVQVEGEHVWGAACGVCLRCGMTREAYVEARLGPPILPAGALDVLPSPGSDPDEYPGFKPRGVEPVCQPVSWWYCDPHGHWGRLGSDLPVTEHEDGTISVQGTIENVGPYTDAWCGTLVRGVWTAIEAEEQMAL